MGDDLLEGFRQSVIDPLGHRAVGVRQWIDEAHRMAHVDALPGFESGEKRRQRRVRDIGRQRRGPDAGKIAGNHRGERFAGGAAQRIEDGAVEQRGPVGRHQRIELLRRTAPLLLGIGAGEQVEGVIEALGAIELDRKIERLAQLIEVLGVGEFRTLLEPLGGQRLGRHAVAGPPVGERHAHLDHGLRGVGDGDHTEAEGEAHLHMPLVALDFLQLHFHPLDSSRPAT